MARALHTLLLVVLVLALAAAAVLGWQLHRTRTQLTQARGAYTALQAAAAAQAASAAAQAQRDTVAIRASHQEITHVAQLARDRQDIERRAADAARQRLLVAADAAGRGQPAGDPTAVGGGLRAPAAVDLLPDVLDRLDQAAGDAADYADALRIALRACRAEYGAVRAAASSAQ